jgi:crotonobetainyl-CoA:carnitine CoA-transferase CaiB-like acyl-CoA transferase
MGAEVIKVERPFAGDPIRSVPPFKDDVPNLETSTLHLHLSMGKKSVTLDAATETGRALLMRLVDGADVLVHSYRPKAAAALGLDYETLKRDFPRLIVTSITYFGQTGPYSEYEGSELTAYAAGGYAYLTGLPAREPLKAGGSQAEYQGGLHAASGTVAALCLRDLTDQGDYLDVSVVEAICFCHAGMSPYLNNGVVYRRVGARLLSDSPRAMYPSTILPCKDGFIHAHYAPADPALLGVLTEDERLGDPDLWETPRAFADEIDERLSAWLSRYDKFEAVRRAQELRHPFTEVLDPSDLFRDEQFQSRGFFAELHHPVAGSVPHLGPPFQMSGTPWQLARAPLLGEHTLEILRERMGLEQADIDVLAEAKVIG